MQDPQNYEKPFQLPSRILWSAINQTFENTESCASDIYGYTLVPEESIFVKVYCWVFLVLFFLSQNPTSYKHSEYQ